MTKIKEVKLKGFITYLDSKSIYSNGDGTPCWEKRVWDTVELNTGRRLTDLLEEFDLHEDVEIIVRKVNK